MYVDIAPWRNETSLESISVAVIFRRLISPSSFGPEAAVGAVPQFESTNIDTFDV